MDGRECWNGSRKTVWHEWLDALNSGSPTSFEN